MSEVAAKMHRIMGKYADFYTLLLELDSYVIKSAFSDHRQNGGFLNKPDLDRRFKLIEWQDCCK
jgi:hypothetical protein